MTTAAATDAGKLSTASPAAPAIPADKSRSLRRWNRGLTFAHGIQFVAMIAISKTAVLFEPVVPTVKPIIENGKFTGVELLPGQSGAPLVRGALAHIECRLAAAHAAGDHTIFVGAVERLTSAPGRPLLYHAGAYHRLPETPGASGSSAVAGAPVRDRV